MVEEKKTKRERNIRSKLMAAIAMLLVSSIMMVSTTYAWFTLSTAPEVAGITTTIASNGNLEIALSPEDGIGANVGDATTSTTDWGAKNKTWGNLVDMGYTGNTYGLETLTLAPAQLALTGAEGSYALNSNALATPVYGSDGRISGLSAEAFAAGKDEAGKFSLTGDATKYGVRAVGTASGLSPQEQLLRSALNGIETNANAAIASVSSSLVENGDALATMLVSHAQVEVTDNTNYAKHVPAVAALVDGLSGSVDYINEAVRAILSAGIVTLEDDVEVEGYEEPVDYFTLANNIINGKGEDGKYINTVDQAITALGNVSGTAVTIPPQVQDILDARNEVNKTIADAQTKVKVLTDKLAADENAKILWADVSTVLNLLMNADTSENPTSIIKICGYSLYQVKQELKGENKMQFALKLAQDTQIELGENSGVYYDIAEIAGNITAKVSGVTVDAMGSSLELPNVTIKTVYPAGQSKLPLAKAAIDAASDTEGEDFYPVKGAGSQAVDTNYGYIIDLMVRTNAASSNLLLQTDPAQRVYGDSTNTATAGKGTSIVFTVDGTENVASVTNLCNSIRIAFFDPRTNSLFGLAKVTSVRTSDPVGKTDETGAPVMNGEEQVMTYTITGYLELCAIESVNGFHAAGDVKEDATLCPLVQNQPTAISALVYLDGNNVTSRDVLADRNVTGALNLQFASSATLTPMMNSDLYAGDGAQTPPATTTPAAGG